MNTDMHPYPPGVYLLGGGTNEVIRKMGSRLAGDEGQRKMDTKCGDRLGWG